MKFNRKLLAMLMAVCMVVGMILPISAAELNPTYGEAKYYDIAVASYSRMLMFQNGVVAAANDGKQYGLIDAAGNVVVPFQYAGIWALGGGYFKVSDSVTGSNWDGSCGIIDSTGKVVVAMGNHFITARNQTIQVDDQYYDLNMQTSTQDAFYGADTSPLAAYDWSWEAYGYYVVQKSVNHADSGSLSDFFRSQYGVMDSSYKLIIPLQDEDIDVVSDGKTTLFVLGDGKVYNTSGKETSFSGQYDGIQTNWNDSPILYVTKGEQRGVIDFTGKVLVPLGNYEGEFGGMSQNGCISIYSYDGDTYNNEGISNAVSQIYRDGQLVKTIQGKYVATEVYYRDLAFMADGTNKVGMMDLDENVILPARYYSISGDHNGNLLTEQVDDDWNYTYGLYTYDGKQIFADNYQVIRYLQDNKYQLYDGRLFGVTKLDGSTVIPMQYTDMRMHTMNFIELYDGTHYSVVDLDNKTIVPATTQEIQLFHSGVGEALYSSIDQAQWLAPEYDSYNESVLPFCYKLADGSYATVYADYNTGAVTGTLANRASLISAEGIFAYQATNGKFGFGTVNGDQTPVAPVEPDTPVQPGTQQPSGWAKDLIADAQEKGLITERTDGLYKDQITRLQFAELAVNLIEKSTGKEITPAENTFTDTSDVMALKAVAAGVASGKGEGTFAPNDFITRQEICVMLSKVVAYVDEANSSATLANPSTELDSAKFSDTGDVSSWARSAVAQLTNNELMSGSNGKIAPKDNTTVEQAIIMIRALCNQF